MTKCDVAILGAGPYGLSAAAHLRTMKGLDVQVFGEPMSFWEQNMPVGMFLRSNWTATQIADPNRSLTLEAYQAATGDRLPEGSGTHKHPVPLNNFVGYGKWYQSQAVADLNRSKIRRISRANGRGYRLELADNGDVFTARRVVLAGGIGSFAWIPSEFRQLPSALMSHTSVHSDLGKFAGKQVLVIGGGQSALESAALLHESGAQAEVIARTQTIPWLGGWASSTLHHGLGSFVRHLLYAPTDVGPAGISQLVARPYLVRMLPRRLQDRIRKRAVRPAGARWLVDRLLDVPVRLGMHVTSVTTVGEKVKARLSDGTERTVDYVLLGTGYRVDITKYDFLSPDLAQSIQHVNGYPVLKEGLEASVPGLHFLGAPAARSFGPIMQFVSGTTYAGRTLLNAFGKGVANNQ
jgi:cation diffusion facilitator CzcD-associated flavoprotein CzcO